MTNTTTIAKPDHAQECAAHCMNQIVRLCRIYYYFTETWRDQWADPIYERIQQMPLSVRVRTGWHCPGEETDNVEYEILLCTGGPAVRITGDLNSYGDPETATLECQDWFNPWTRAHAQDDIALLNFGRLFHFGGY